MLNTKNIWFDGINFVSFQGVLTAFTCARAIGNLWSICLGVNVLSPSSWIDLYLASDTMLI